MISDVETPKTDPKLVVFSVISPQDELIKVKVSKSLPLYSFKPSVGWDNQFPVVNNATVTISDGINNYNLSYDEDIEVYIIDSASLKIIPGRSYNLKVKTPDGFNAESSCTVPVETPAAIQITGIDYIHKYGEKFCNVNLQLPDLPGNGQFYRISLMGQRYEEYAQIYSYYHVGLTRGDEVFSDKNREGTNFTFRTGEIYLSMEGPDLFYASVYVTDEAYYNYHYSLMTFEDENPFSEPTPIFSNIKGGLGVFAAVNGRMDTFDISEKNP